MKANIVLLLLLVSQGILAREELEAELLMFVIEFTNEQGEWIAPEFEDESAVAGDAGVEE
jgi:hypothetical protein